MHTLNVVTLSVVDPDLLTLGSSSLLQKCEPVPVEIIGTSNFLSLVRRMFEIMYANDGAGLAAPQVGVQWRFATIHPGDDSIGPTVLINPTLVTASDETEEGVEACISLPDYHGIVTRPKSITIESLDLLGKKQTHSVSGWLARLFMHELDHLDGIVYPMRMNSNQKVINQNYYQKKAEKSMKALLGIEESQAQESDG